MYFSAYLQSAKKILQQYDGSIPFSSWLKNYFKQHKKFGSKDRKLVGDLCYSYFRLGKAFIQKSIEEQLLTAQFLCHPDSEFIKQLKPEWSANLTGSIDEKLKFLNADAHLIFPFADELSNEIDSVRFPRSHFIQPDLFLRIRPGKKETVLQKLNEKAIQFEVQGDCIRLPNMTKIDEVAELDKEVVVQDLNSQKVLDVFLPAANCLLPTFSIWDCCAASGGKTILLHDYFPKVHLTVSDIRDSILHNLRNRFKRAGIHQYKSFIADISSPSFSSKKKFDVVICDAPCSGSGTWSRTPEQLAFFKKDKINYYVDLQKRIVLNASKSVKEGGYFLYITCSVFKQENEDVVRHLLQQTTMKLESQQYFEGYSDKADTLFTALFSL